MSRTLVTRAARARRQAGLTQLELAAAMRCGHAIISMVETRRVPASRRFQRTWGKALGVDPADFFHPKMRIAL
jgi:transcriptional regulator with XRE-family HTH domain